MNSKLFKRATSGLLVLSGLLVGILLQNITARAAVNITYTWTDQQTINVAGTSLKSPENILMSSSFLPGSTYEQGVVEVIDSANNCYFNLSIMITSSGVASASGLRGNDRASSTGSTTGPPACTNDVYDQYTQDPITFTNSRGGTPVADETSTQKAVDISVKSTLPISIAAPTITVTIAPASSGGGPTTVTVTLTGYTDAGLIDTLESYSYSGVAEGVEPGRYTISDSVGIGSVSFEKIKYKRGNVSYGETIIDKRVTANVNLSNYPMATTDSKTFGPLTLVLTPPDGSTPVEIQTNSAQLGGFSGSDTADGTTSNINASISGEFDNVEANPNKYKVCVKDTAVCAEFTKVAGQSVAVDLALTGDFDKFVTPTDSTGDTDNENTDTSCESSIGLFGGLVCPALTGIDTFIGWAENLIEDRLTVDLGEDEAKAGLQSTWLIVARLASGVLVAIALVMVIATALGSDLVSPYALKKVLPRLVIGAMGIWLSWALVTTYIGIINDLGRGISSLMLMPFGLDKEFGLKDIAGIANIGGGVGGVATGIFEGLAIASIVGAGVFGILSMGLTALFAFLVAIFVLALRQAVIIFLVVLAPLGFAMWILPNTQKTWKLWSGTLNKLLIMYPMIMGLLTAGKIFAWITSETAKTEAGFDKFLAFSIALIAYVAPYFFLPALFKAAGGVFSNLTGMINDKGKGLFDKSRGWLDKKKSLSNRELAKKNKEVIRAQQRNAAFASGMLSNGPMGTYRRARYGGLREQTRLRRRATAIGIQSADLEKTYKDQGTLLDHDFRAQATLPGGLSDEKDYLLKQAMDGTGDRRQAAIDRLSAMRAINHLERLHANLSDSAGGRRDWETAIRRNRDNLREAAPHIASSTGAGLDIDSLRTASAESANKWSMDTWKSLVNSGNLADATRIAGEIRGNRDQWARVGGSHNPAAPAGAPYNGMKDFFGRTLGIT